MTVQTSNKVLSRPMPRSRTYEEDGDEPHIFESKGWLGGRGTVTPAAPSVRCGTHCLVHISLFSDV